MSRGKCSTFVGRRPTEAVSVSNGVITVYHAARDDKSRTNLGVLCGPKSSTSQGTHSVENKKLSCRRGTARCVVSVKILPTATQQCRNYLYDKS